MQMTGNTVVVTGGASGYPQQVAAALRERPGVAGSRCA